MKIQNIDIEHPGYSAMKAATVKDKPLRCWIKRKEKMPKPFQYTERSSWTIPVPEQPPMRSTA
jgi:hypothetical protein